MSTGALLRAILPRSTPVKLALAVGLIQLVAILIAGCAAYKVLSWELQIQREAAIHDEYVVISASFEDQELSDLVDTVNAHVRTAGRGQHVYALVDHDGRILAGNLPAPPVTAGWATAAGKRIGLNSSRDYRLFAGDIGGNRLVVGQSDRAIEQMQEIVLGSMLWASVLAAGVAIAGAIFVASRVQRRLEAISGALAAVTRGEVGRRVPLIGRDDDVDMLARAINSALDRMVLLIESLRQVGTDIAHDLRSPMNRFRLMLEAAIGNMERGHSPGPEIERAIAECGQITDTFDALLRIAQIEGGARKSRFVRLDLSGLARDVAEVYGDVAEENGQTVRIASALAKPLQINGDRDLLTQLLANLIENAIRHCPAGTGIEVATHREDGRIVLTVADDGPGIPEDERANVLRRLYRLEKSRSTPGSGLGLSLVKAIAELHDAELQLADNRPGLKVLVRFPEMR